MRAAPGPAGLLAALLVFAPPALAQTGPDIRHVSATRAEVRSGASDSEHFFVTNVLGQGHPVEVVAELPGGWLKIRPPAGSFSWINTRFLEHIAPNQPTYVMALDGADAPVFIGSEVLKEKRPTVIGVRLKRGTQVVSVGKTRKDAEGEWMPIEPPPAEVRYIKSEHVGRSAVPATTSGAVLAGGSTGPAGSAFTADKGGAPATSKAPSANPAASATELWQKAVAADRGGQTAEAIKYYSLLAAATTKTNPTVSSQALRRAAYLQTGYANPVAPAPATSNLAPPATPPVKIGAQPGGPLPAGYRTYRGTLYRAGRAHEDRKMYRLEMSNGMTYVTAGAGVDLERQVGRTIEVSGPAVYDGGLRANFLTAMRVGTP